MAKRKATARSMAVPAPIGGWNARDSLAQMEPTDAVILDNWFPDTGGVQLRKGFTQYTSGIGGTIRTLAEYHANSNRKFIAGGGGKIWDISDPLSPTQLATGFSNNAWQTVMFEDKMGFVNGSDAPQSFDGTTCSAMTVSGSGLTVSNLVDVHAYKSRTYFIEKDTQNFWYSAVNALGGALIKFPLGRIGTFGGNLLFMATWSRDAGDGMDDLAVFVMTSGEVIVYTGSDPGSDYTLVGVFQMGEPLSRRGYVKVGGDLIIMTRDGFIPMSKVFSEKNVSDQLYVSYKINGAVNDAVLSSANNFGWEATLYSQGNRVLFNIPIAESVTSYQFVVNTITGAWCRFKNMNASCFTVYNNRLYFAFNNDVFLADDGNDDNGSEIQADGQPAFNTFKSAGNIKTFTAAQVILSSSGVLEYSVKLGVDYKNPAKPYISSTTDEYGSAWDVSEWGSPWTSGEQVTRKWKTVFGLGYSAALRFRVSSKNKTITWYSTNYIYKIGGPV